MQRARETHAARTQRFRSRLASLVVALPFLLLVGIESASANADLTAAPKAVIEETVTKVLAVLSGDGSSEQRITEIEQIAYEVFDFTTMSKLTLARGWRKLDDGQKREFVQEFKRLLSRTYGSRVDSYSQEKVEVYGVQVEPRDDVTIKTMIKGGQYDGVEINYRLRNREDRWRIIDVVIEGVSLVSSYRSQFKDIMAQGGPTELLSKIKDKNFKVEVETPAAKD